MHGVKFSNYVSGAPEVGLNRLEPLDISSLTIGQGNGPVNVQQNFKNVKLHGLTGSKINVYKWVFFSIFNHNSLYSYIRAQCFTSYKK